MEWISVKDRLPEIDYAKRKCFSIVLATDGNKVLQVHFRQLFQKNKKGDMRLTGYIFHTFCSKCTDGDEFKKVTHWMPLPPSPLT